MMGKNKEYYKLVRDNIKKLTPYSSARHEFSGHASVHLDANENPFDYHMYNRYPDPLQWDLKKKIGKLKGTTPETIFIGNGSDEPIDLLIRIFCTPGQDAIHVLEPTYGMYRVAADINDVEVHTTLLTESFEINEDRLFDNMDAHDRILWICSPNNPSGNVQDQQIMINILNRFDGIVVVDEAYIDFSKEASMVSMLQDYDNLVVLQTFSKAWGMAGLRCGLAFSSPWIIDLMNAVKPPYNVNEFTQKYLSEQLEKADEVRKEVSKILQERDRVFHFLESLDAVEDVFPSEANFILFRIQNSQEIFSGLQEKGIIVRNRTNVPLCKDCLRVTIGTEAENDQFMKQIKILCK
ncbi:histidinol-phosphate transaminase [Membranihabitans marinus]|nr:histidinol-phosphate transaminase [Membranihabitans marinus]